MITVGRTTQRHVFPYPTYQRDLVTQQMEGNFAEKGSCVSHDRYDMTSLRRPSKSAYRRRYHGRHSVGSSRYFR